MLDAWAKLLDSPKDLVFRKTPHLKKKSLGVGRYLKKVFRWRILLSTVVVVPPVVVGSVIFGVIFMVFLNSLFGN